MPGGCTPRCNSMQIKATSEYAAAQVVADPATMTCSLPLPPAMTCEMGPRSSCSHPNPFVTCSTNSKCSLAKKTRRLHIPVCNVCLISHASTVVAYVTAVQAIALSRLSCQSDLNWGEDACAEMPLKKNQLLGRDVWIPSPPNLI